MLEKDIENRARLYVEMQGGQLLKFTSPGKRGVPDRVALLPRGRVLFIEFKAPGKKPTAQQMHTISDLVRLGHRAVWVDSFERAKAEIDGAIYS
jgi:hypothetical protein